MKSLWEKLSVKYQTRIHRRRLAAIYKDQMPGGAADDKTPEDFDPEVLKEGAEHEMEHTYDPELATEIAMDHLTRDPDYYKKLKESGVESEVQDYYRRWKGGFRP